jgi:hypothetical protein
MSIGNVILHGIAMAGTWLTVSGVGGMLGNFTAMALRRSAEECAEWTRSVAPSDSPWRSARWSLCLLCDFHTPLS